MDEFLEAIMMAAGAAAAADKKEKPDIKKQATDVARLNKALYDAHIEQGFKSEEALMLVKTIISAGIGGR